MIAAGNSAPTEGDLSRRAANAISGECIGIVAFINAARAPEILRGPLFICARASVTLVRLSFSRIVGLELDWPRNVRAD